MRIREERLTKDLLADIRIGIESLSDLDPESGEIPQVLKTESPASQKKRLKPRNTVFDDHGTTPGADA
jgi:hypothetical protein